MAAEAPTKKKRASASKAPAPAPAPEPLAPGQIEARELVTHVLFRAEDSGYTVLRLDSGRIVTITSREDLLGKRVHVIGKEVAHPKYGKQLRADKVTVMDQLDVGLVRYLASGRFTNIGETLAACIVGHFGDQTRHILDNEPGRLSEAPKMGKARAAALAKAWAEPTVREEADTLTFLYRLGLTPFTADRLRQKYASHPGGVVAALSEDPYRLPLEVDGFGFKRADALASSLGFAKEHPTRLRAGLDYVMDVFHGQGFCAVPTKQLMPRAEELLGVDTDVLRAAVDVALRQGDLVRDTVHGEACLADPALHGMEARLADKLLGLAEGELYDVHALDQRITALETQYQIKLHPEQRAAVLGALRNPVTVITGGPGTGKSTITRFIVQLYKERNHHVGMAAPTGKAAVRQAEVAGDLLEDAPTTLHRMLGASRDGKFKFNRHNPLEADVIVVDEPSMLDVPLAYRLLDAIAPGSRLVFTGDVDQLPSVGPGKVLADMITSKALPVCWLTEVYRQSAQSPIWLAAQAIREGNGSAAAACADNKAFVMRFAESADQADVVVSAVNHYIKLGLDPLRDIQVMTGGHQGSAGTLNLNRLLQDRLNLVGHPIPLKDCELRVGDKVLQTANDYDLGIVNGDTGVVRGYGNGADGKLVVDVDFNSRVVGVPAGKVSRLKLAYAMTVHKMQGSETKAAIVCLSIQHFMLLKRNLLYTGMTRGKQFLALVTDKKAFNIAVHANPIEERWSRLSELLANPGATTKPTPAPQPAAVAKPDLAQPDLPF